METERENLGVAPRGQKEFYLGNQLIFNVVKPSQSKSK